MLQSGLLVGAVGSPPADSPVPNVIGLSEQDAEDRLEGAGYRLEIGPSEEPDSDDAVLRQSPLAGWGDLRQGRVRVAFTWSDDTRGLQSLPSTAASAAVSAALQKAQLEGRAPGQIVEVQPLAEDPLSKGELCELGQCMLVHLNSGDGGATVVIDLRAPQPVVDFSWYPTRPWPPGWVFTDDEIVAAALADPQVVTALRGKDFTANLLSGGTFGSAKGPPCELPNGVVVCATVALEVRGESPGLVSVNYVTLEVRLDRKPGDG